MGRGGPASVAHGAVLTSSVDLAPRSGASWGSAGWVGTLCYNYGTYRMRPGGDLTGFARKVTMIICVAARVECVTWSAYGTMQGNNMTGSKSVPVIHITTWQAGDPSGHAEDPRSVDRCCDDG